MKRQLCPGLQKMYVDLLVYHQGVLVVDLAKALLIIHQAQVCANQNQAVAQALCSAGACNVLFKP